MLQVDAGVLVGAAGVVLALISIGFARLGDSRRVESRITSLETKMELFWDTLCRELPAMLISGKNPKFDGILARMASPSSPLTVRDSYLAISFIEDEVERVQGSGDTAAGLALVLLKAGIRVGLVGRE